MTESKSKIRSKFFEVEQEFFRTIATLVISAFSLVAALAWNTAITKILDQYLSLQPNSTIISWVIYAVIVTLIAVVVTVYMTRISQKKTIEQEQKELNA